MTDEKAEIDQQTSCLSRRLKDDCMAKQKEVDESIKKLPYPGFIPLSM